MELYMVEVRNDILQMFPKPRITAFLCPALANVMCRIPEHGTESVFDAHLIGKSLRYLVDTRLRYVRPDAKNV